MQAHQIELIKSSFAQVGPVATTAATLFYANLFKADPGLRPFFKGDMTVQGERLMSMIGAAVGLLDRPAQLTPVLRKLGERHVQYGVREAHYATVGNALIETLAQALGDGFDKPTKDAWLALYGVISATMLEGASQVQPVPF